MQPLILEWEPGSDVIGDFTWPGFDSDIVITERVALWLSNAGVSGFELGPVTMVGLSRVPDSDKEARRVALPYTGPRLSEIWVTAWTNIDPARSTARLAGTPEHWEVSGVERRDATWDPKRMQLVRTHHPRLAGQGLFVKSPPGIFRVHEFPGWMFCTDETKRLIEDGQFTNVSFLEMGDAD